MALESVEKRINNNSWIDRSFRIFKICFQNDGFKWFWMGSLHKNIQLMLEFLKDPFLVLHFPAKHRKKVNCCFVGNASIEFLNYRCNTTQKISRRLKVFYGETILKKFTHGRVLSLVKKLPVVFSQLFYESAQLKVFSK